MRRQSQSRMYAAVFVVVVFSSVISAHKPLVTDCPDYTDSSNSVGSGILQLESGVTFLDVRNGTDVTTIGEILARWGVAKKYELRLLLPDYTREGGCGGNTSGFLSSGVGFKYELAEGDGSGFLVGAGISWRLGG